MPKKKHTKKQALHRYHSQAWLSWYGQGLKPLEIRLVQAYRGLDEQQQAGAVMLLSSLVIQRAQEEAQKERR